MEKEGVVVSIRSGKPVGGDGSNGGGTDGPKEAGSIFIDPIGVRFEVSGSGLFISARGERGTTQLAQGLRTIAALHQRMRSCGISHETYECADPNDRAEKVIDVIIIRPV